MKKIAMLLAALIVFVGCQPAGNAQPPAANTAPAAAQTTAPAAASQAATAAPAPVEENKPELKALTVFRNFDMNTYPVALTLEEMTGYKVKYDNLPADNGYDKLNLIIASGEPYDLIWFNNTARYMEYAKQGALVEISDLLAQYGSNITSATPQESFDALKIDGELFCVPTLFPVGIDTGQNHVGAELSVRQDWLDKLGMAVPETVDEFTEMLRQFKDQDPGGNGDANIPLTSQGVEDGGIRGAFGIPFNWNDVDGKLVNAVMMPGYSDYLEYCIMLYNEGLLDKEFPTNNATISKEKQTNGRAGVRWLNWADVPAIMDALTANAPDAALTFIPPLSGPGGAGVNEVGINNISYDMQTMIPKSSQNPEHAMKYLNLKMEPDIFKAYTIGFEGVHHTYSNGTYSPIQPIFFDERGQGNTYLTGSPPEYRQYWLARLQKDMRLYDAYMIMNFDHAEYRTLPPNAGSPLLESEALNGQVLNQMVSDMKVKIVSGASPLSYLDEFRNEWLNAGGQAFTDEMNAWYANK